MEPPNFAGSAAGGVVLTPDDLHLCGAGSGVLVWSSGMSGCGHTGTPATYALDRCVLLRRHSTPVALSCSFHAGSGAPGWLSRMSFVSLQYSSPAAPS
jgi:hypothetical protein